MKPLFLAASLLFGVFLAAQPSLERQVFASQGASGQTERIRLDWTLGEPAVAIRTTASGMLTEGFQQATLKVEAITIPAITARALYDIRVAPNPTASQLSIQFPEDIQEELVWELLDLNGKILHRQIPATPSDQSIDLSAYPDGVYLLRFFTPQKAFVQTYRIVKTR